MLSRCDVDPPVGQFVMATIAWPAITLRAQSCTQSSRLSAAASLKGDRLIRRLIPIGPRRPNVPQIAIMFASTTDGNGLV